MTIRNIINIIEAAGQRESFILQPALDPSKYQITNSMRDVEKWKAYVYAANSCNDDVKIGDMDDVGYTMISLKDNTIIPIARSDEHHMGYDMLSDLQRKFRFNARDYVPVFWGNNYIYHEEDRAKMLTALRKYISYGGNPNTAIKGSNDFNSLHMTIGEFVARNGDVTVAPGEFPPLARDFLKLLDALAAALETARQARDKPNDLVSRGKAFVAAAAVLRFLDQNSFEVGWCIDWKPDANKMIPAIKTALTRYRREKDTVALEELFFDFHGVKNAFHNKLRETLDQINSGNRPWNASYLEKFWGTDLEMAIDRLGRY